MYIASEVVKKEDEEWIRLHPQTLHTYRLPDKPCWIAVYIKNETHFLKRMENVQAYRCLFKIGPVFVFLFAFHGATEFRWNHAER